MTKWRQIHDVRRSSREVFVEEIDGAGLGDQVVGTAREGGVPRPVVERERVPSMWVRVCLPELGFRVVRNSF